MLRMAQVHVIRHKVLVEGLSIRRVAREMGVSRNTVRAIIRRHEKGASGMNRKYKIPLDRELLERLYDECGGYAQRVHEKLVEEHGIKIEYSTLTRRLRELEISMKASSRAAHVGDEPGAEMQHDTSSYDVALGGVRARLIASVLYLRYSKRRYVKFYRRFDRFRMKCFFHEALTYWGYAAPVCIIDNTNLARLSGSGKSARMTPAWLTITTSAPIVACASRSKAGATRWHTSIRLSPSGGLQAHG